MSQLNIAQLMDQAVRHHQAGRLAQAEELYRQILSVQPNHADALHLLGVLAHQVGQNDIAIDFISQAIALKPSTADFHCNLGNVFHAVERIDEAIVQFERAVVLNPNFFEAHNNLANSLKQVERIDEAIAASQRAIKLNPKYPQAHNSLGSALRTKGLHQQAIASLKQALSLKPNYAEAFNNLGNVYRDIDRIDEAIAAFRSAANLKPELADIHNNLAGTYEQIGQYDQAISMYCKAAELPTSGPKVHLNFGIALLREGNFAVGWKQYEWRWQAMEYRRDFVQPIWDGNDLQNRRILIHAEQGLGDTIQFARYLPLVAQRGGRIIVQCQAPLTRLLRQFDFIETLITQEDLLPEFDVHCAFLSLPHVLGTTLETIPATVPYLRADPELSQHWKEKLSQYCGLNVGLVWAGRPEHKNDRNRSMRLSDLAPLSNLKGIQFHSLQKGPAAEQLRNAPPGFNIHDWSNELHDLADTAAVMDNLDLIISVDTAPAHLAGALGKPTWLLVSFVPEWRWLRNRDDSPWYPTMKLFRQEKAGEWNAPVQRIVQVFEQFKTSE